MEKKRNTSNNHTMNAHYLRTFYERHPERREEYRYRYAINLLRKAGYTIQAPAQDQHPATAAV